MEASQTAPAPAQPDAPAEEAAPAAPATPEPATPEVVTPAAPQESEQKAPDLSQIGEQIGTLQERFDSQFPKEDPQPKPEGDFWDALTGDQADQPDEGLDTEGQDWLTGIGDQQPAPMFNSQQELDAYVQEKAAEVLQPYAFDQEMKARAGQLGQLETKYPDITDYVDRIRPALEARAEQYGINPQFLASDPTLVEDRYLALKAAEASAAEVDAEGASNAGASLETGTGPGSQGSEQDPGEAFANSFSDMARASTKDAFS